MASVVRIKRSSVQGKVPRITDLDAGELALNTRDGKLFSSDGTVVFEIGANTSSASIGTLILGNTNPYILPTSDGTSGQILKTDGSGFVTWQDDNNSFTVQQVDGSNTAVESYTSINTLQFDEDSGFDVVNPSTGVAKIRINSTFKYWEINGVPTITAEGLDTINFVAGDGIEILASNTADPKTLEIRSTANNITSAEYVYNAVDGQTVFSGVDSGNNLMAYESSTVDVFLNGVKLIKGRDFFANNGTTIVLDDAADVNDTLQVLTTQSKQSFVSVEADLKTNSHTTTTTSTEIIDQFGLSDYRSAKYMVQIEGVGQNSFQVSEVLLVHNGSTSFVSETNVVTSGSRVANISSDVSSGVIRLKVTPISSINLKVKFSRLSINT